ncbi:hypothetical protein M513_09954, partial [Trichuris suis]
GPESVAPKCSFYGGSRVRGSILLFHGTPLRGPTGSPASCCGWTFACRKGSRPPLLYRCGTV